MISLPPLLDLPPELTSLREDVRDFLKQAQGRGEFRVEADAWMSGISPDFSRELARKGWVGITVPVSYGGHGGTSLQRYVVSEELLAAGAPVAAHWIADRQMAPAILNYGTENQKHKYLPGIVAAERFFSIGMSEPDAGSDLASIRTRAVPERGGWRIEGAKMWTSVAHVATNLVVLARTDATEAASDRHRGLSQFVVDLPHPDIHVRPIVTIDGGHHFNEVVFDGALVPESALLGERGEGWRQVTHELAHERSGPERILSTLPLLRAWAATLDPISDPVAGLELGRLTSRLVVLRQLSFSIAEALRLGQDPAIAAALVKDLGTTYESEVVEAVRRHACVEPDPAADGFSLLLAHAVLHTPAFTLRGGTNEILRSIVSRGLRP